MNASGTLINHCGASLVSKEELDSIPAPNPTQTWFPVKHGDVLHTAEETIKGAGFDIKSTQLSVSRLNQRFFGVLDLESDLADGVALSVGLRNSNDKSFPIGFCIGNRTFVCDNLAFSAEIVISKRHTRFGEDRFRDGILKVVEKLPDYQNLESERIAKMKRRILSDEQADAVVLRAWDRGIVGTRMLRPLIDEWREPSYPEFEARNAWSLLSAYTHVLKERQHKYPSKTSLEVMQFQALLAA